MTFSLYWHNLETACTFARKYLDVIQTLSTYYLILYINMNTNACCCAWSQQNKSCTRPFASWYQNSLNQVLQIMSHASATMELINQVMAKHTGQNSSIPRHRDLHSTTAPTAIIKCTLCRWCDSGSWHWRGSTGVGRDNGAARALGALHGRWGDLHCPVRAVTVRLGIRGTHCGQCPAVLHLGLHHTRTASTSVLV